MRVHIGAFAVTRKADPVERFTVKILACPSGDIAYLVKQEGHLYKTKTNGYGSSVDTNFLPLKIFNNMLYDQNAGKK